MGIFVLIWNCYKGRQGKIKVVGLVLAFCILSFGGGLWRALSAFDNRDNSVLENFNSKEKTVLSGKISSEPDIRSDFSQYVLEISGNKKLLIKTSLYPEYFYGDILKITGKVEEAENFGSFDYKNYLAKDNIFFISRYPEITLIKREDKKDFYGYLLVLKKSFTDQINKILPEPQASFLSALLVGAKRSLPDDLIKAFNATGTSHIIAISGYNISIIAALAFNFLGFLLVPRRLIFWLVGFLIVIFTLIAGAGASVVRAAVMGGLILLAKREGRFYDMSAAIVLAAALMLFFNPYLLRYDTGFKLSFLATLGLIYLSPYFEKWFTKMPEFFSLKSNFVATLSAQIATFPVLLFDFGRFSLISIPANILILPSVPPAMLLGFLTTILSFVSLKVGSIVAVISWFLLSYQIRVAELLSVFAS